MPSIGELGLFDIKFFQKVAPLKKELVAGKFVRQQGNQLAQELESLRSSDPILFNAETTNNCNMKCIMCPRTTHMTRPISNMSEEVFTAALQQLRPHDKRELEEFWKFVRDEYEIRFEDRTENSFYFYIVSQCLTLHGYGEPLLDKKLIERVREATSLGFPTYLSCVPANLTVEKGLGLMEAGLTVLKVSIDALDDENQKKIRGGANNFSEAFDTVKGLLAEKKSRGLSTLIVPTMISFSDGAEAKKMQEEFLQLWDGLEAYAYVKSLDNRWKLEEDVDANNNSHYSSQYCEFPWTSLSIQANGDIVPCTQFYDLEFELGNIKEKSLVEIWNSESFREFRRWHATGEFPEGHKCNNRCDQKKLYQYLK